MTIIAVFTEETDGRYSVMVPSLPGCFSQGDSLSEAKKNIQEAIELYIEDEDVSLEEMTMITQFFTPIDIPAKR